MKTVFIGAVENTIGRLQKHFVSLDTITCLGWQHGQRCLLSFSV